MAPIICAAPMRAFYTPNVSPSSGDRKKHKGRANLWASVAEQVAWMAPPAMLVFEQQIVAPTNRPAPEQAQHAREAGSRKSITEMAERTLSRLGLTL